MSKPKYRWVIIDDHIDEGDAVGIEGPNSCDSSLLTNSSGFQLFDDDGELYYSGRIYGEYTGFEPLDDYGTPNAGCTEIRINGVTL